MELRIGSATWLRRFKAFRALEATLTHAYERLETANADLQQLQDEMERMRTEVQLARQVLDERLAEARAKVCKYHWKSGGRLKGRP